MDPTLELIAKHLRSAEELIRSRRYSEALIEVEYVFQLDPRNYQGRTLQERIKTLQKKQEETPGQVFVEPLTKEGIYEHLRIADYHLRGGRYDDALIEIDRILKSDPGNYQARSLAERIRSSQKKADAANDERLQARAQSLDTHIQQIARHLKDAENYIDAKQYTHALEQVAKVFRIDPNNHLAQAYSQTIEALMNEIPGPPSLSTAAPAKKAAEIPLPSPMEKPDLSTAPAKEAAEVPLPSPMEKPDLLTAPAKEAAEIPLPSPMEKPDLSTAPAKEAAEIPPPPPKEKPDTSAAGAEPIGRLLMYREILNEMWFDGILSERELAELKRIRALFDITDEQHAQLEKEIKIEAYVDALRVVLHDGTITASEERVLELMRKRFGLTMEQHKEAEAKILEVKKSPSSFGTILIVDDEKTILLTYSAILHQHGYKVLTAETVEAALAILEKQTPDLILSDVMFPSPNQGGFEFYNQVRNIGRFDKVPFLLMSGISDEYVVRAGMRLGIDAYLIKPFGNELLLATIEGKLKV